MTCGFSWWPFRRVAARLEADSGLETEALLIELSLRLTDEARIELGPDFDALRALRVGERAAAVAALFCRVEDHLANAAEDARAFRRLFREQMARRCPRLAAREPMSLILLPPGEQEVALCRFFLQSVVQSARNVLGSAGGDRLGELRGWLAGELGRDAAIPFAEASAAGAARDEPVAALQSCSRGLFAWLQRTLGERAGSICENAYHVTARRFGAAEGFPAVLGMVPDRLLTADKLSLLRRSQIEKVLKEKIAQLERANADIQHARDTLEERVRERTRELQAANGELAASLAALSEAKRQAEDANRAKSDFLANMSHELRTPLNAILGFSQMMKESKLRAIAEERYPDYARHIYDSGAHLLAIIEEILDTAKLEAGRYELDEETVSIPEVVEMCLTTVRPRLEQAGLGLERALPPSIPKVTADRRMLVQMLLNLLSNAINFTEPGGTIRVEARLNERGGLDLAVHDTGIGIDEENIALVLQPFRQVRSVYLRGKGGTGLGLPLVVGMARLHGGDFVLRSKPGKGTSAIISLPASRLRRPQLHIVAGRGGASGS